MRLLSLIFCLLMLMTWGVPASAAGFESVGTASFLTEGIFTSGRISALGGSDLTDGSPAALMINPSPLSEGSGFDVSYDHANYFPGFEFKTYAGSVQWNSLRLNVAMQDFSVEDLLIRTAYDPEGTGETFDMLARMTVMGLSYDLGRGFFNHPHLRWSVGGAWRHYYEEIDDSSGSGDGFDLGSTMAWRMNHKYGWSAISGSVSWQNVSDATFIWSEREMLLPSPLRAGLTMEMAWDWLRHEGDFFKVLVAYSHSTRNATAFSTDSNHAGVEFLFMDAIALRWGQSSRVTGNIGSWGVGLMLDGRLLGPFTVQVDLGEMGYDNAVSDDSETIWGMRVGYDF